MQEDQQAVQENYDFPSNVRNVIFVLSDGNEVMRNYAYLVAVDLLKEGEKNVLEVGFTSTTILIEGYRLVVLRDLFIHHLPKIVMPGDSRYFTQTDEKQIITSIVART